MLYSKRRLINSKIAFALVFATIAGACRDNAPRLPYYDTADFTPKWEMPAGKAFHKIRPFRLIDQQGQPFTEKDIDGKICVVDFFFTACPGICPKMTKSMAAVQQAFANDDAVLLLSHSVTPDKDSVPVLQRYAQEKKVDYKRWKLLTGDKHEIYDLGRKYYFVEEDEGVKQTDDIFLHTENFVLIDGNQHIRGIYNGLNPTSMEDLVRDIKVLEDE